MTKPPFLSKQEMYPPNKRMILNLGLRVLFLCAICIILPLAAYIFVIWKEVKVQEIRDVFEQIAHLGNVQKERADLLFAESFLQLRAAHLMEQEATSKEALRHNFLDILAGYPNRTLCTATKDSDGKYHVVMSTEKALEGQVLPYGQPTTLPIQRVFIFFCECSSEQMGVMGMDGKGEEKILLVFPASSLLRIASDVSEWAGTMGIALLKDDRVIAQKPPMCSGPDCVVYTDDEVRRILNDESELPNIHEKSMIGEKLGLETVPLTIRVNIPPIYYQTRYSMFLQYIALILLLTVIFGAVVTVFLTRHMVRPFKNLAMLMQKAGEGDLSVRYLPQYMGFEINSLGSHFNHMLEALTAVTQEAKDAHVETEKLLHECALGHSIQRAIFPRLLPRLPQYDIATSFSPANEVAGDFYDLFLHDTPLGKRLLIAIGDASGKGMAACLYSFLLRSMLRSFAATGESLEKLAENANQLFCLDTESGGMFVTAWIGILEIDNNRLHYASFGHYPAVWKQSTGEVVELETKGSAFGMPFTLPIATHTVQLSKNDQLFLYTDGWIETKLHGVRYNRQQLIEWLHKLPDGTASKEVIGGLETLFAKEESTEDDRTALAIRLL